jgi:hypothetical protein
MPSALTVTLPPLADTSLRRRKNEMIKSFGRNGILEIFLFEELCIFSTFFAKKLAQSIL